MEYFCKNNLDQYPWTRIKKMRKQRVDWQHSPPGSYGVRCKSLSLSKKSSLTGDIQAKIGRLLFQNRKETHASKNVTNNVPKKYGCTNTRI